LDSSPQPLPIEQAIDRLVEAANGIPDNEFPPPFRAAVNAFAEYDDQQAVRTRVAERLGDIRIPRAIGFLAVWLGCGVENGLDPEPATPYLMAAMLRLCRSITLPEPDEDALASEAAPVDRNTLDGLQFLGHGLVAHLARAPAARATYAGQAEVLAELERVEVEAVGCLWVHEILTKRSGTLLALHVEGHKGVRVRYENISNFFHLFTLLQAALADRMPGAQHVSADVVAVARGESQKEVIDSAWWHYGPPMVPEANVAATIWGELSPQCLPKIDGEQVMLLWPPLVTRHWDGNFFLPHLEAAPARVEVIDELTSAEFQVWQSRLNLPLAVPKPR